MNKEFDNLIGQQVWGLWLGLDAGNFDFNATQGPTMQNNGNATECATNGRFCAIASSGLALNASIGYGNYNGGFIALDHPALARVADA